MQFQGKNAMLTAERRSIVQVLQGDGQILASELSRALHVSEEVLKPYRLLSLTIIRG
jgi:DNA-binding Lrp family transcriptional regulator